ncbi:MAG: AlpA family phage regulatory protein [Azonexus sp.]
MANTVQQPAPLPIEGYARLPHVLAAIPVSRATWWAGCKSGKFPKPVKLGPRTTVWKVEDLRALIASEKPFYASPAIANTQSELTDQT